MSAQRTARPRANRASVRAATLSDAKRIATLITALGYPTNASEMKSRLAEIFADSTYTTLVAEVASEVVGMAGACLARFYEKPGLYARLVALVVSEAGSGQGAGAALVRAIEKWGTANDAAEIFLNSGMQREVARSFYEKLGYRVTGVRFSKALD
jgi:GNAT superfamily N-acetyltransferase